LSDPHVIYWGLAILFTAEARRFGIVAATAVVALTLAYAGTLTLGLWQLNSPDQPIGNPTFAVMEVLISLLAPAMVALMAAVHAWGRRCVRSS